ncbi:MAG TPA: hypothetical protein VHB30_02225, partial [Solirubrobacteraceae bacterium]|nr:hypothetical protein [Solirubrobacteraceae bacterium]
LLASEPGPGGADPMVELATACRERGLVVGSNFSRVTVAPPCNTDAAVVEEGLAILDEALEVADRYVGS